MSPEPLHDALESLVRSLISYYHVRPIRIRVDIEEDPGEPLSWRVKELVAGTWVTQPGGDATPPPPTKPPEPPEPPAPASAEPKPPTPPEPEWEPTDYQCRILEALEFRALRTDALVAEIGGDRRRLWKAGGVEELKERGLVRLDKRVGYFRPDCPPEGMDSE